MPQTTTVAADAKSLSDEELFGALWRDGDLQWLLDSNQKQMYAHYRAWEASVIAGAQPEGTWPRIYVADCARRVGKDFYRMVIRHEDAIRHPKSMFTYATAFQKDITDILIPICRIITEFCPDDVKPQFRVSKQGESMGFYFPNGSIIKLVGIDKNPDGLRGRASHGVEIGEAGFVDHLRTAVVNVLYPQLQGQPRAVICLQSTPAEIPGHAYDDVFVPEAIKRGAYIKRTINDNPRLTDVERKHFIDAAGGLESSDCQREYFCERKRNETRTVVPEFTAQRNAELWAEYGERPRFADCYVGIDPGIRDMCGIIWGYFDFEEATIVIERAWAKRNANTAEIADVIKSTEAQLWHGADGREPLTTHADGKEKQAPYSRVSDIDLRMIADLRAEHGVSVAPAAKDDKEAAIHALRNAIQRGKFIVDPVGAAELVQHIEKAVWNKQRTDYERSEIFGHFDLVDAAIYLTRHISRNRNPFPFEWTSRPGAEVFVPAEQRLKQQMRGAGGLNHLLNGRGDKALRKMARK